MNVLDLLILGAAVFAGVRGLRRGLGREAIGLGATALLLFAGLPLAEPLGVMVVRAFWPAGRPYAASLGFLALTLAAFLAVAVLGNFWRRLMSLLGLGWLDGLGGLAFGVAKAAAVWLIILAILAWVPLPFLQDALAGSQVAEALLGVLPGIYHQVEKIVPPGWPVPLPRPRTEPARPRAPGKPGGPLDDRRNWQQVREGRSA